MQEGDPYAALRASFNNAGVFSGNLTLGAKIAEGSQGIVFAATHPVRGDSAVKIFMSGAGMEMGDTQMSADDFAREASLLQRLAPHPNVMPVDDSGVHVLRSRVTGEKGPIERIERYPFMAMPLANGGSLQDLLRRSKDNRLKTTTAVEHILGIAAGIGHAHSAGVTHRDVKPANILLSNDVPRLADFGIVAAGHDSLQSMTSTKHFAGTLPYAAPEQMEGKPIKLSDLYSLGIVGYLALTGKLAVNLGNDSSPINWYLAHVDKKVAPIKLLQGDHVDHVAEAVGEELRIAMSVKIGDRHRSMGEFIEAVRTARDTGERLNGRSATHINLGSVPKQPPKTAQNPQRGRATIVPVPDPPAVPIPQAARPRTVVAKHAALPTQRAKAHVPAQTSTPTEANAPAIITPQNEAAEKQKGMGRRSILIGSAALAASGLTLWRLNGQKAHNSPETPPSPSPSETLSPKELLANDLRFMQLLIKLLPIATRNTIHLQLQLHGI